MDQRLNYHALWRRERYNAVELLLVPDEHCRIVETAVNNPTFSYPNTAMAAWLCRSLQNPGGPMYCAAHTGDAVHCLNNTPSQGQIFYGKITFGNIVPPKPYAVYAVDGCDKAEGVTNSRNVPGFTPNTLDGFDAISTDMKAKCVNNH